MGPARRLAIGLLFAAGTAASAWAGITDPALLIVATNQTGTAQYLVHESWGTWQNGQWSWQLTAPLQLLTSTGQEVATLNSCVLSYTQDPVVSLSFNALGGASTTNFTFSSALLSFAGITGATGVASAGVTLTDNDGNGASLGGLYPGGMAYRAQYNGLVPAGTDFGYLIAGPVTAGSFGTNVASGSIPSTPIPGTVSSASTQWNFSLSAHDSAAGTSVFNIIPGPGSGALLALAGLAGARRRR